MFRELISVEILLEKGNGNPFQQNIIEFSQK